MTALRLPAVVRGQVVEGPWVDADGRAGTGFATTDPHTVLPALARRDARLSADLDALDLDDVVEHLVAFGRRLDPDDNPLLRDVVRHSAGLADVPPELVRSNLRLLPALFTREALTEVVDAVGRDHLTGWPETRCADGRVGAVHAFGLRAVHVIAGNSPLIAAMTVARTALTRGEAVVKTPSNDPLTMVALARTMIELDPDHPLTRAVSVAYWKGGDPGVEARLYDPAVTDRIVAWGGTGSVRHALGYLGPGLELVTFDPKNSATVLGPESFDPAVVDDVAHRLALDVGAFNQVGCVNARVVYAACGTGPDGIAAAEDLGRRVHAALQTLPPQISTPADRPDPQLRARLRALRTGGGFHTVIGDGDGAGAVIVSHLDEPVEFADALTGRVANIVPVDSPADAVRFLDAGTQTVGVHPPSLRRELRAVLPRAGVQRTVDLGAAVSVHPALPQDGFEPVRRLVRWAVDEHLPDGTDPLDLVFPPHRADRPTDRPTGRQEAPA